MSTDSPQPAQVPVYFNPKKTRFLVDMVNERVDVLGRHIQNGGVSVAKPQGRAPGAPTSLQELGKDLGPFTWLTDHIRWAATLAAPLKRPTIHHHGNGEKLMNKHSTE